MKCSSIKIGDSYAIVCGRSGPSKKCTDCGRRPVTKLCDYQIREVARGKLSDDEYAALTTCSRGLCDDCARRQPQGTDYCRIHEELAIKKQPVLVVAGNHHIFEFWLLHWRINPKRVIYCRDARSILGCRNFVLVRLNGWYLTRGDRHREEMVEIIMHLIARGDLARSDVIDIDTDRRPPK